MAIVDKQACNKDGNKIIFREIRSLIHFSQMANDSQAATIRFHLPQGTKVVRRFMKTDTIQVLSLYCYYFHNLTILLLLIPQMLFHYLNIYFDENQLYIQRFAVSTNYPKRQLDDLTITVEGAVRNAQVP